MVMPNNMPLPGGATSLRQGRHVVMACIDAIIKLAMEAKASDRVVAELSAIAIASMSAPDASAKTDVDASGGLRD